MVFFSHFSDAKESARRTDRWACVAAVIALRLESFSLPSMSQRISAEAVNGLNYFKNQELSARDAVAKGADHNFLLSSVDVEKNPEYSQFLAQHLSHIVELHRFIQENPKWEGPLLAKKISGDDNIRVFLDRFAQTQAEILNRLSSVLNVHDFEVANFNAEKIRQHFLHALEATQDRKAKWAYYYHQNKVRQATATSFFDLNNNLAQEDALDEIYADAVILNQWAIDRFMRTMKVLFSSDPNLSLAHKQLYNEQLLQIDLLFQIKADHQSELIILARTKTTGVDYSIGNRVTQEQVKPPTNMTFAPVPSYNQ